MTSTAPRELGLFTSADCAEAIAGDLIEERSDRGVLWFWRHVLGTVLIVSRGAVAAAPLQTLTLVAAGVRCSPYRRSRASLRSACSRN